MVKVALSILILVFCATPAFAWPRRNYTYSRPAPANNRPVEAYTSYEPNSGVADNGSAQGVAELQARAGSCRHFGGNSGYEGVGFSSSSADDAIRHCCYWGQRKPRDIGVARGRNGWYACVRYY